MVARVQSAAVGSPTGRAARRNWRFTDATVLTFRRSARARMTRKRMQVDTPGPNEPIRLDEMIHLHLALDELSELDPVASEIVHLRYFLGYSLEETGELVGRQVYEVRKEWDSARIWLLRKLRG